jgi:hypothetical protein
MPFRRATQRGAFAIAPKRLEEREGVEDRVFGYELTFCKAHPDSIARKYCSIRKRESTERIGERWRVDLWRTAEFHRMRAPRVFASLAGYVVALGLSDAIHAA